MRKTTAPTPSNRSCKPMKAGASVTQKGVSLIEVMVAMAIGLFILLLISLVYVEGARHLSFRQGQSENLANSRYTLDTLESQFSKAGYRRDPTQSMEEAFPALTDATTGCAFARGQAITVDGAALCIRFQARDASETDCSGNTDSTVASLAPYEGPTNATVGAGVFVERFAISDQTLVCTAQSTAIPVALGVRDIHFEYGVGPQTASMALRTISSYTSQEPKADEVVRSLKYAILLAASKARLTSGIESSACSRWKTTAGDSNTSCDESAGHLYQIASGALNLRNLMP